MSIAVAIAHSEHVPQRRAWVAQMTRALAPLQVRVCPARGRPVWPTNRDAIASVARSGATHGLWLQDDMLPVPGFADALTRMAHAYPDDLVSLYSARKWLREQAQHSMIVTPDQVSGGTVLAPTYLWQAFLSWEREHVQPSYPHDDRRVSLWLIETGGRCLVANPNLLEHLGASHSLLGHSNSRRVSARLAATGDDWQPGTLGRAPGSMPLAETRRDALKEQAP